MIYNKWCIGHVTYSDHLIYGKGADPTVAQHGANIDNENVWRMIDKSLQTYWEAVPTDSVPIPILEFTFAYPIIFEKLVILKRTDQPKLR